MERIPTLLEKLLNTELVIDTEPLAEFEIIRTELIATEFKLDD
jgi:hypothetical protein